MTPKERELIAAVADRLRKAGSPHKDTDAEAFIAAEIASQPDAAYLLTQAVILQEHGLAQAQQRIDALQAELEQAQRSQAPQPSGSFLGGLFRSGREQSSGSPGTTRSTRGMIPSTPDTIRGPNRATAAGAVRAGSGFGDFMRGAAAMAVGVAGGHLLFNGLSNLFDDTDAGTEAVAAETSAETETDTGESSGWGFDDGGEPATGEGLAPGVSEQGWEDDGQGGLADAGYTDEEDLGGVDLGDFDDDSWG